MVKQTLDFGDLTMKTSHTVYEILLVSVSLQCTLESGNTLAASTVRSLRFTSKIGRLATLLRLC